MPDLDPSSARTVADFAQSMGLSSRQNDDGSFGFDFENAGRLSILSDETGDTVLVSLTRRIIADDVVPLARLAGAAGYIPNVDLLLQAGLNKAGQPVLTTALQRRHFDLPRLDATFAALRDAFDAQGI